MIKSLRHCGIVVADLEVALRFYRDLLGLKVVKQADETGVFLDNMLELQDVRVTTVKMSADEGPTLVELLMFTSHPQSSASDKLLCALGPTHIAFTVQDLDEVHRRLEGAGVRFNAPPQLSPDGYAKVTFCRDFEGNPIELVEVLEKQSA